MLTCSSRAGAKGTLQQKEGVFKQWHERWFELSGTTLTIRKSQDVRRPCVPRCVPRLQAAQPLKTITLTASSVVRIALTSKADKFAFEIATDRETDKFVRCRRSVAAFTRRSWHQTSPASTSGWARCSLPSSMVSQGICCQ